MPNDLDYGTEPKPPRQWLWVALVLLAVISILFALPYLSQMITRAAAKGGY